MTIHLFNRMDFVIRSLYVTVCFIMPCMSAVAQIASGADITRSPVKTITDQQYAAYINGIDSKGLNLVAALNKYPLPDDVLQYKNELSLTAPQIKQLMGQSSYLHRKMKEIGNAVIRNERTLDSLFRTNKVNEGVIIFYSNRYGLYEGEMRTSILTACYNAKNLLTNTQLNKFEQLRKP
jgi:hypothetical protein